MQLKQSLIKMHDFTLRLGKNTFSLHRSVKVYFFLISDHIFKLFILRHPQVY